MTDWKCPRCDQWFEYEDHDTLHLEERTVEALERIAAALEKSTPPVHYSLNMPSAAPIVDARARETRTHDL